MSDSVGKEPLKQEADKEPKDTNSQKRKKENFLDDKDNLKAIILIIKSLLIAGCGILLITLVASFLASFHGFLAILGGICYVVGILLIGLGIIIIFIGIAWLVLNNFYIGVGSD